VDNPGADPTPNPPGGAPASTDPAAPPSEAAAIHRDDLLQRVEDDWELLRDIVGAFADDWPQQLALLVGALANDDASTAVVVAHRLKGALANLSAPAAADSAARIERLASAGELAAASQVAARLHTQLQSINGELNTWLGLD
jgi:HPt (histidine-containing phosphotransfer) domain-containing protein